MNLTTLNYIIQTQGEINSPNGMKVCIMLPNGEKIGETNIISFTHAIEFSKDLKAFMENKNDMFNNDNTIYQYGLKVNDDFQRQGWGEKLKNECNKIVKDNGFKYITNIVSKQNHASQGLMNKLGYKVHQSNDIKDLLYYTLS
jgi:ribosomal protein S18 acetylase RimI-like enzyme